MAAIPSGKNVTEFSLTLITAPFALRKSVPSINSEDSLFVTWILTHCMLLILMAEGLTPCGMLVEWSRLGLGIGCVVVGVVDMRLLPMPDRIPNLLPGLTIFDPLGPSLRSS